VIDFQNDDRNEEAILQFLYSNYDNLFMRKQIEKVKCDEEIEFRVHSDIIDENYNFLAKNGLFEKKYRYNLSFILKTQNSFNFYSLGIENTVNSLEEKIDYINSLDKNYYSLFEWEKFYIWTRDGKIFVEYRHNKSGFVMAIERSTKIYKKFMDALEDAFYYMRADIEWHKKNIEEYEKELEEDERYEKELEEIERHKKELEDEENSYIEDNED
jgi:hypothetical protein